MTDTEPTITAKYIPPVNTIPNDTEMSRNTYIMSQTNAGNIEYLKQRMDVVQNMYQQVRDLSGNVTALFTQVNGLAQAQQQYATQIAGSAPPDVSGTD